MWIRRQMCVLIGNKAEDCIVVSVMNLFTTMQLPRSHFNAATDANAREILYSIQWKLEKANDHLAM